MYLPAYTFPGANQDGIGSTRRRAIYPANTYDSDEKITVNKYNKYPSHHCNSQRPVEFQWTGKPSQSLSSLIYRHCRALFSVANCSCLSSRGFFRQHEREGRRGTVLRFKVNTLREEPIRTVNHSWFEVLNFGCIH
jgi:hypothetical protein